MSITFWAAMILSKLYFDSGNKKTSLTFTIFGGIIFVLDTIALFTPIISKQL